VIIGWDRENTTEMESKVFDHEMSLMMQRDRDDLRAVPLYIVRTCTIDIVLQLRKTR
jgi:hypothetical protein